MTIVQEVIVDASQQLQHISDTALLDSEVLLLEVLNKTSDKKNYNRAFLRSWPEFVLNDKQLALFKSFVSRRFKGEPIAYILGYKEFWSVKLKVNKHTLIPRPDTEILVEKALSIIPEDKNWNILDLGTGSGAIALALALERPQCRVYACDNSSQAIAVATENAANLNIKNSHFFQSDWFESVADMKYEMIVSNPPYIKENDVHLKDLTYEPLQALVSGSDGLDDSRLILKQSHLFLKKNGYLLLEHGFDQAIAIQSLFKLNHYQNIEQIQDLNKIIRLSLGQYSA